MKKSRYNVFLEPNDKRNKGFLFNIWKGSLISLDPSKATAYKNNCFEVFEPSELQELNRLGFLTDIEDEFKAVVQENLEKKSTPSKSFSVCISPTTKCNAHCAYCFENGISKQTMSIEKADEVINWIIDQAQGRNVIIRWFGGEPLVGADIISYISKSLKQRNIKFHSSMISNGYLIDKYIHQITEEWRVTNIQITLDDLYEKYNQIKNFTNDEDAFNKVISNIHFLAKQKIIISIRINFDSQNIAHVLEMIDWIKLEFGEEKNVHLYCNHLMGDSFGIPCEQPLNPYLPIMRKLSNYGYIETLKGFRINRRYQYCAYWDNNFYNIAPDGLCYQCEHDIGKGIKFAKSSIDSSFQNKQKVSFEPLYLEKCKDCICFPICGGGCIAERRIRETAGCLQIVNIIKDIVNLWVENITNNKEVF